MSSERRSVVRVSSSEEVDGFDFRQAKPGMKVTVLFERGNNVSVRDFVKGDGESDAFANWGFKQGNDAADRLQFYDNEGFVAHSPVLREGMGVAVPVDMKVEHTDPETGEVIIRVEERWRHLGIVAAVGVSMQSEMEFER